MGNWRIHLSWQDLAHWPVAPGKSAGLAFSLFGHCLFSDQPTALSHTCLVVPEPCHFTCGFDSPLPSHYLVPHKGVPKVAPPENATHGGWTYPGEIHPQNSCRDSPLCQGIVSPVCVPYRDKEGRLQAAMSMFASLRICPSLSVPEVACQGGAALSFICVSGSPGPHGSQEGRICWGCWRPVLYSPFRRQRRKEILSVSVTNSILNLPTHSWLYQ